MSPLQYQKTLRLQEARRLMLSKMMDAGIASRNVGYASASQFSREYGRLFRSPAREGRQPTPRARCAERLSSRSIPGDRYGNMTGVGWPGEGNLPDLPDTDVLTTR